MTARERRAKERRRLRRAAALSGTLALGLAAPASAADFTTSPIKDVNAFEAGSTPTDVTPIGGGVALLTLDDGVNGRELWRTDGTAAGTSLVKDINPGGDSSDPSNLVNVGGTVFFRAGTEETGDELWKSDGTAEGTVLVKEIRPGDYGASISDPVNLGGTLIFAASDGTNGHELWRSDGTDAGTTMVKDIHATSSSSPQDITVVGGTVYFSATDATNGRELFKSNGTEGGTGIVENIRAATDSSDPQQLTNVGSVLYFSANDGSTGRELWRSIGDPAGTDIVENINPAGASSDPIALTNVNGTLAFAANDGTTGTELWRSSGNAANTNLVKNVRAGAQSGAVGKYPGTARLHAIGSTLFFAGSTAGEGLELWKSNLTEAGTVPVKDIRPGNGGGLETTKYATVTPMADAGGTLFFLGNDGTTGTELWRSNGTEDGTTRVRDIRGGPNPSTNGFKYASELTDVGGTLMFAANDGVTGSELWRSDGTESGTTQVENLDTGTDPSVKYGIFDSEAVGGTLFFVGDNGTSGVELFKTDGTAGGTGLVKDVFAGEAQPGTPNRSEPRSLTNVGGTLFFSARDAMGNEELWKSDGTDAGTSRVKDIVPGGNGSSPYNLTNVGGTLFFTANDATMGRALWKSDGTEAGTVPVKDVDGPMDGGSIRGLRAIGGTLYFAGDDGTNGEELWRSDGTETGTTQVKNIAPAGADSSPRNMTDVNGTILFSAVDGSGRELWRSDGTEAGTVPVKDIRTGPESGMRDADGEGVPVVVGSTLFFAANDGTAGFALWKSDGTPDGTTQVKSVSSDESGVPQEMTNVGGTLFFQAGTATTGRELWRSDGTEGGTTQVSEIRPGSRSSYPYGLTNVAGTLLFRAENESEGEELWQSDGTGPGTKMVRDIKPGRADSFARGFEAIGDSLFFFADDGRIGGEPWKAAVPAPTPTPTPSATASPTPTPIAKRKPKLRVKVKPRRDRRRPYVFRLRGTLLRPSGVTRAQGCSGKVRVVGRKKKVKKPVFLRTVRVTRKCTFTVKARLKKRAGRRGRVTFVLTYRGNTYLRRASKKVTARFG